jgi:hypothetical protein
MTHGTTRISADAHGKLREMSKSERKPMQALLDEAVEALRRPLFLEKLNATYATLRSDANAWETVERERRAWDVTLPDDLAVAEGRAACGSRPRAKRSRDPR